jgi:hypothetical protein
VTSFESLKNQEIVMLENDSLYSYFKSNSKAKIKTYKTIDDLVKNANNKIIVVDSEVYRYYQNNKFKKYKLLFQDNMMNDYKFMVKGGNEAFYNLFNYIINTNSYYNYRNSIRGIIEDVSTDYKNLDFDATQIQEKLKDPDNLTLLKDVVKKLG